MLTTSRFRILLLWLSLCLQLLTTACSQEEEARPTTGTVEGTVVPADALRLVTATATDGRTVEAIPDATTGRFSLTALPAGAYTLTFSPATGYVRPEPVKVTAENGRSVSAGRIVSGRDGLIRGMLTWNVGSTSYSATLYYGSISKSGMFLTGATSLGATWQQISLVIPGYGSTIPFQGVGTYPLGEAEYPFGDFTSYANGNAVRHLTGYPGFASKSRGLITVTRFDENARTAAGTFEFVGTPLQLGYEDVTVTNGRFDVTF
ncbi:carboxypeptidase-like regulatory domain-containing protein [Hymenobacter lucidus]|uniref:Carboxypeptidase-like regulatory domain-containing protein n=1 Tax=Hymenobacter lucidus TaxID=2880930 RepID=A0ABS8AXG3_9BACT|nr:carboxypeptidase-like regulatory domain-containing protein [Hymenobacter lucidus]MCB2410479.1 carboxypeptidase-like regulatory domain-containing protein [Hymenobacter lucidus]